MPASSVIEENRGETGFFRSNGQTQTPLLLGMFHRQIDGDHHLLELAQRRFTEAGLGAEFYPSGVANLQESLEFRPLTERRYTMHLPRNIRLLDRRGFDIITAFASRGRTDAYGMIIHDQREMVAKPEAYIQAIGAMNDTLLKVTPSPYLFIEYAVGLDVQEYEAIFEATSDCERVSACIDISHVGIREAQRAYAECCPGEDVCHFRPDSPELPEKIDDVVAASASALPTVLELVRQLGRLGKPLHFHIHDGHPLSTFSPYGISDHLSFYQDIRIPFEYQGETNLPLMFGPDGLRQIVQTALEMLPPEKLSFMLEIHPQYERLDLGDYAALFKNWKNLHNAERMHAWIEMLLENLKLLRQVCAPSETI